MVSFQLNNGSSNFTTGLPIFILKDITNGYVCLCTDGYEGDVCEHDHDDCIPYPCENGGNCTVSWNEFLQSVYMSWCPGSIPGSVGWLHV